MGLQAKGAAATEPSEIDEGWSLCEELVHAPCEELVQAAPSAAIRAIDAAWDEAFDDEATEDLPVQEASRLGENVADGWALAELAPREEPTGSRVVSMESLQPLAKAPAMHPAPLPGALSAAAVDEFSRPPLAEGTDVNAVPETWFQGVGHVAERERPTRERASYSDLERAFFAGGEALDRDTENYYLAVEIEESDVDLSADADEDAQGAVSRDKRWWQLWRR